MIKSMPRIGRVLLASLIILLLVSSISGCKVVMDYHLDECRDETIIVDSSDTGNDAVLKHGSGNTDGFYAQYAYDLDSYVICANRLFRGEGYSVLSVPWYYTAQYYLEAPDHSDLSPLSAGWFSNEEMTLSGWFKTTSGNGTIITKAGDVSNSREYRIFIDGQTLKVTFWDVNGSPYTYDIKPSVSDGIWHAFAVTARVSGANLQLKTYFDGNYIGNHTGHSFSCCSHTIGPLMIGAMNWGYNHITDYFTGYIDELIMTDDVQSLSDLKKVYDCQSQHKDIRRSGFSTQCYVRSCPSCSSGVDHYRIEHPATGITCQAATVVVRACANDDCSQEYDEATTVTMSATSSSSDAAVWVGGATRTFTGHTEMLLQQTTEAIETLELTNPSPVATNLTRYYEDDVEGDNTIQFNNTGIFIDGDASDSNVESDIVTQIAGKPSDENPDAKTLQVKVLRTDDNTGTCVPALLADGNARFSYLVPVSEEGLTDNTVTVAAGSASTALTAANTTGNLALSFDNNGVASFVLTSADAGKYQLKVEKDILVTDADGNPVTDADGKPTGATYPVSDTSNAFVVRPLVIFADAAGNKNAQNANSPDSAYKKAGESFTLNFKSLAWTAGRDANNNGTWDAVEPDIDSSLSDPGTPYARVPAWDIGQPTATVVAPTGGAGSLTYDNSVAFVSGDSTTNVAAVFDEVGIIQLAEDKSFLGETVKLYSPYIGRFIPDHFVLTLGTLTTRVDSGCTSDSDFTYLGENLKISYTLTVQNSSTATTKNYEGDFAKFDGNNAVPFGSSAAKYTVGALDDPPTGTGTVTGLSSRIDVASATKTSGWSGGTGEFEINLSVARDTVPDGPFNAVRFGVAVQDGDNVAFADSDLDLDVDGNGTLEHKQVVSGSTTVLKFGRLRLDNAHGSELLALPMIMRAEYWSGSAFINNIADNCSTFSESDLTLDSAVENGVTGENPIKVKDVKTTQATIGNQPVAAGDGDLEFRAPGTGGDGWVDVELTVPDYLQFDWHGAGDDNPTARATFGIYKGSKSIIYLRETTWR